MTTSIIATIGPASNGPIILLALREAGMTVARLNGSHGNLDWHRNIISLIRETIPDVPILLDIPGRKIRTIQLKVEPSFHVGDRLILTTDLSHDGTLKTPVNYDQFHLKVRPGVRIYADDGTLSFLIEEVRGNDVHLIAETAGILKSRKGINVPEIQLGQDLITSKDREMIAFAKLANVDYVGISFVESAEHIQAIRHLINSSTPQIVAKVENQGGLNHLEEIAIAADVIMIDRGDLSVETSIDHVTIYQKQIIAAARQHGKPVIVATELLHSMIESPLPTKAEVGDITNAVIDGASAVMLSGETAVGKFPIEAVARLRGIITLADLHRHDNRHSKISQVNNYNDLRIAVQALTRSLPITKIVVLSKTGYAARLISMAHIEQPIIAIGNNMPLVRGWNLLPGTVGVYLSEVIISAENAGFVALEALWKRGLINQGDIALVILATDDNEEVSANTLQTIRIGHLAAMHQWQNPSALKAA